MNKPLRLQWSKVCVCDYLGILYSVKTDCYTHYKPHTHTHTQYVKTNGGNGLYCHVHIIWGGRGGDKYYNIKST